MKKVVSLILTLSLVLMLGSTSFAASGSWQYDGYGWWYLNQDGSYPAGTWQTIDGYSYHFDSAGYMQTGWIFDGDWYYLTGSGIMATGWVYSGGTWYYMSSSGIMQTGWVSSNNAWYYFDEAGAMVTGTRVIDGAAYQFADDGTWIADAGSGSSSGLVGPYDLDNYYDFMRTMSDSEFLESYYTAAEIVKPLVGMDRSEQLYWIAVYLRAMFENGMSYSMSAPHYNDPYGYLILGAASCAGCAKATGLCLNILGIPYEHVNEGEYSHQWCRVYVNGEYWICDAYGLYVGPEPSPYVHPYLS